MKLCPRCIVPGTRSNIDSRSPHTRTPSQSADLLRLALGRSWLRSCDFQFLLLTVPMLKIPGAKVKSGESHIKRQHVSVKKKFHFWNHWFSEQNYFLKNMFWNHWFYEQKKIKKMLFGKSMVSKHILQKNNFVRKNNGFKTLFPQFGEKNQNFKIFEISKFSIFHQNWEKNVLKPLIFRTKIFFFEK